MAIITVKQDGTGDHTLIQNAINSASAHDVIEIQDSETYYWPQSSSILGSDNLHAYPPPGYAAGNAAAGFNPDDWGTGHPGYYSYYISASLPMTIQAGTASDGSRYTPTWSGLSASASGQIAPRMGIIYGSGLILRHLNIRDMCSSSATNGSGVETSKFGKLLTCFVPFDGGDAGGTTVSLPGIGPPSCSLYFCTASHISGNLYSGKGLYNTFESSIFHDVKWSGIQINNNNAASESIINNCIFYLIGSGNMMNIAQDEADTTSRIPINLNGAKCKVTHNVVTECGYTNYVIYCFKGSAETVASFNIVTNCSGSSAMIKSNTANDNCLHNNTDLAEYAGGDRDGTKKWWHNDTSAASGDAGGLLGDSGEEDGNLIGAKDSESRDGGNNPYFTDADTGSYSAGDLSSNNRDYTLTHYSPCRAAGTGSTEGLDRAGRRRDVSISECAPSIGAEEYHLTGTDAYSLMTKDAQYDIDNDFTINIYKNLAKQYQTKKSHDLCGLQPSPMIFSLGIRGPFTLRGRVEAHSASVGKTTSDSN